jgi:Cytochrome P450
VSRLPGPRSPLALLSFFRAAQHDSYAALTELRERYGPIVRLSAYITGRDPSVWSDPEAFRPQRWNPSAPGYEATSPYASVAFGGGARRCIGFAFAELELKLMTAQLVRHVDVSCLLSAPPRPTGIASVMPAGGVPIRITRSRTTGDTAAPVAGG